MVKITAVGDMFFGDYTISLGFGMRSSIHKFGYEHHLRYVNEYLNDSDIVFGNLETILSDHGKDDNNIKSIICRGKNEFVNILKYGGFNAVNIANNHILQHGIDAFHDTIDVLKNYNIDTVGLKGSDNFECRPIIKIVHGKRIGILGYSFLNENFQKGNLLYATGKTEDVIKDIIKLKMETDYVIVSCHWGIEYIDKPSQNIRRIARKMVDSGASLILGHHPHVVQGIEKYNNSIIFYSLGNFLFDFLWSRRTRESVIAKISIDNDNITYNLLPVVINNEYQIVPMEASESKKYKEYVERLMEDTEKDYILDKEESYYKYYVDAHKLYMINQAKKTIYMLENIYRLDKRFLKYILKKLIS